MNIDAKSRILANWYPAAYLKGLYYHDQVEFILWMWGWFSIQGENQTNTHTLIE